MGDWITYWLVPIFVVLLGLFAGYVLHMVLMRTRAAAELRAGWKAVEAAKGEAEAIRREAQVAAREEIVKVREAFEAENASRRKHLTVAEERLSAQQADLDRRAAMIEKKEAGLEAGREEVRRQEEAAAAARREAEGTAADAKVKLAEVAALPRDEARRLLLDRLDTELSAEQVAMIRRRQEEARRDAEERARSIITAAIERFAAIDVYRAVFRPMRNTLSGRDEKMVMKLIVDAQSNRVIGAHVLGPDAGEFAQLLAIPLKAGCTKADFDRTMAVHPTAAEELVTLYTPSYRVRDGERVD